MATIVNFLRRLTNFKNPFVASNTPVEQAFHSIGALGHFLCVFPTKVKIDRGMKNDAPRYHTISTVMCLITIISSVLAVTFPLYPYLKSLKNKPLSIARSPTDDFALRAFLIAFLISRLFAPIICILYCKPIATIVQKIASYDKSFNIINKTPLITTIFCILLAGSLWDTVTDGITGYPQMIEGFKNREFSSVLLELGVDSPNLSVIHCYSGRIYGEIGVVFCTFCMLYFGRLISQRIENVKASLAGNDVYEDVVEVKRMMEHVAPAGTTDRESHNTMESAKLVVSSNVSKEFCKLTAKKVVRLADIKKCFEDAFGTFLVLYFSISVVILVMTVFCIASYAVHQKGENIDKTTKDFIGLFLAISMTCLRMTAFVECGQNLSKMGKLLTDHIAYLDSTSDDLDLRNSVRYLQHIGGNVDFSYYANGYFLLNRRLIPSIIAAVLTFTMVLAQFRSSDA